MKVLCPNCGKEFELHKLKFKEFREKFSCDRIETETLKKNYRRGYRNLPLEH